MPMPDPIAGAIEAQRQSELATQAQSAQSQTPQAERVAKPNENDLSDGARRLLHMQEDVTRGMEPYYKNPDQAYERLTQLDTGGREEFRRDPSSIGQTREEKLLSQNDIGALATASSSHGNASPEEKHEYAQHNAKSQSYEAQQKEQGPTNQMNDQLTKSMANVQQIGTI